MKTGWKIIVVIAALSLALTGPAHAVTETFDSDQSYPTSTPTWLVGTTLTGNGQVGVWTPMASSTPGPGGIRDLELLLSNGARLTSNENFPELNGAVVVEADFLPEWNSSRLFVGTRAGDVSSEGGIQTMIRMRGGIGPYIDSNVDVVNDVGTGYCGDDNGVRYQITVHEDTMAGYQQQQSQYHLKWTDDAINRTWRIEIEHIAGPGSGRYVATGQTDINEIAGGLLLWGHATRKAYAQGSSGNMFLDDVSMYQIPEPVTLLLLVGGSTGLLRRRR